MRHISRRVENFGLFMGKFLWFSLIIISVCSCTSHKKFLYFQSESEGAPQFEQEITNRIMIRIQPDDRLAISVRTLDPKASAPFNLSGQSMDVKGANSTPSITDYLVDIDGDIEFPGLGEVHLGGLTTQEAKDLLLERLDIYLKDAIINIRFTNFKITILGEVRRPASYVIDGEQLTITEALGLAGDITDFGSRESIVVIREQDGKREHGVIDMSDVAVFNSEYYYLRQNDVLYIPPTKTKSTSVSFDPYGRVLLPVLGALLSAAALIVTLNR